MNQALKVVLDSENYRMSVPGCGAEAWWEIRKRLSTFAPAASLKMPSPFFWASQETSIGDFFSVGDPWLLGITYSVRRSAHVWQMLEKAGEIFPIEIEGFGEALILRVMTTGSALDCKRSQRRKLANGNYVVYKPVLDQKSLPHNTLVRLQDLPLQVLLTEEEGHRGFRYEYARHGLTGLYFEVLPVS